MKKLILSLAIIASTSVCSLAQNLDEIVSKHIEAIGGADNWKKIKTLQMDATMKAGGAEIKVKRTQKHDEAMRLDISVMGMNGYQILTKTEGWAYMPFQGQTKAEPMTADDVKTSQDELSVLDEFITYKELGKKLDYLGKDDLEGTECHKIKMTDKDGKEATFWIDASNFYTLKQNQKIKANGKEVESITTYSNYKKLPENVIYAHSVSGDWGETEVTSIIINGKIDDSIFKPSN